MKTKWTPGRWFISRSELGIHKYIEARIGGGLIQEVACCGPTAEVEQSEANAQLVATAPELYDALDDLVNGDWPSPELWVKARAVLAKARGE